MENVTILSSLNNPDQRGGAYLRVQAIKKLYESIGLSTEMLYHEQFSTIMTIKGFLESLKYGKKTKILFRSTVEKVEHNGLLHLDNLRHFNWKIDQNAPILFNAHNLEFENFFNRKQSKASLKFKKYEIEKMKQAKCVWLCSQREKDLVNEYDSETTKNTFVIPNLVDKNQYYSGEKRYISFIGTLDYYPNRLAIDFIFSNIVPYLKGKDLNGHELVIAGRNPLPEQIELAKKHHVKLLTNLSQKDMLKLYSETKTLIVPLEEGSGTRLKIVEALFSNARVISTELGAEGINDSNISICELHQFSNEILKSIKYPKDETLELDQAFTEAFDLDTWINKNKEKIKEAIFR